MICELYLNKAVTWLAVRDFSEGLLQVGYRNPQHFLTLH